MSIDFTSGVPVGTSLRTLKAVKVAIVKKDGIFFEFKSPFSEETRKILPVTVDQYNNWLDGESIQYAMPHLTADDRELFLTGMTF